MNNPRLLCSNLKDQTLMKWGKGMYVDIILTLKVSIWSMSEFMMIENRFKNNSAFFSFHLKLPWQAFWHSSQYVLVQSSDQNNPLTSLTLECSNEIDLRSSAVGLCKYSFEHSIFNALSNSKQHWHANSIDISK